MGGEHRTPFGHGAPRQAHGSASARGHQGRDGGRLTPRRMSDRLARASDAPVDQAAERGGAPVRVLVVDDEEPILDLVRGYLEREGWTVVAATNGDDALEIGR